MPVLNNTGADFERVHIPPRVYAAKLTGIREAEIPHFERPNEKQRVLFWQFDIAGKTSTVTIEGMTTFAFGEKSKARKWTKAMLGAEPPNSFDTDDLIGMDAQVLVGDKTKDNEAYSVIADVLPRAGADEEIPF